MFTLQFPKRLFIIPLQNKPACNVQYTTPNKGANADIARIEGPSAESAFPRVMLCSLISQQRESAAPAPWRPPRAGAVAGAAAWPNLQPCLMLFHHVLNAVAQDSMSRTLVGHSIVETSVRGSELKTIQISIVALWLICSIFAVWCSQTFTHSTIGWSFLFSLTAWLLLQIRLCKQD